MVDGLRAQFPNKRIFSHKSLESQTRLDRFYIPKTFLEKNKSQILPNPFLPNRLGHDIVRCHIQIPLNNKTGPKGPGIWKFNTSLLDDPYFVGYINALIDNFTNHREYYEYTDPHDFFDGLKAFLRHNIREYSRKAKQNEEFDLVEAFRNIQMEENKIEPNFDKLIC